MASKKYNRSDSGISNPISPFFVDSAGNYKQVNSNKENRLPDKKYSEKKEEEFTPKFAKESWNRFFEKYSGKLEILSKKRE